MSIRQRHRTLLVIIIGALVLSCLPGCDRSGGKLPGNLYLRLSANPTTLDPALITDVTGGLIAAKLFNGLVRFNERLEIVPDLAGSWKVSSDHRTYTFTLRRGFTFSNGREVTARDVQYSFERVLDPRTKAPVTWVLDRIEGATEVIAGRASHAAGIRVIDDHTLSLTLARPFGPFLSLLGMSTAYVVPREEVARLGADFGSHPSGSGPYTLTEWKHGQSLALAARSDYFGGRPRLEGIIYRVIPEDLTAVMEFETGGLDALLIPASEYRRYTTDPKWRGRIFGKPGLNCYYLGLNCSRPPFNDVKVRQAVNMAIDRKRILETVYENRGVLAAGPVPPPLWKFGLGPKDSDGYRYDPEEARQRLREAGLEGARIRIFISAEAEVLDLLEVIQQYLSRAGLKADIVQLDWSAYKEALNKGEADAFWLSWWADYPDPENFFYPMFHSANRGPAGNRTWFVDRAVDRLIKEAQSTVDERDRYRLYRQADERIVQEAPWVFMWHRSDFFVVQPRVQDFRIYPIYSVDKGMDISLKQ
ncbi:MAG: peptide transporter substrate-binding protein [Nitrospirae bacterium]|nr:peptide transporter substrate-binding protein [Nitrospirota bacterium]